MALAALALAGACAGPGEGVSARVEATGEPGDAWDAFPVDQVPRPIVVTGEMVEVTGFRSGEAKLAFQTGRLELRTPVLQTPTTVTVDLPEGQFTFPALAPEEAFAYVRAQGSPANAPDADPAPIEITRVTLGVAEFSTDRGPLPMPAWLFGGGDIAGVIAWPAVGKEAFWRYGEPNDAATIRPSQLSRDGRRIRYTVPGHADCPSQPVMRYRVDVTETVTTVVLTTVRESASTPRTLDKDRPCEAVGAKPVPYDVDLANPLGNRVVITHPEGATVDGSRR